MRPVPAARIDFEILNTPYDTLWERLQHRNQEAAPAAYPLTQDELRRAWELFEHPSPQELASVDSYLFHTGGLE